MLEHLDITTLLNIYETEISKNVKNKKKLYNFEINKMQYMDNIMDMLKKGCVGHEEYNIFLIYEPKCRLVMSLSVRDKLINHFVTRYILEKNLSKDLDPRNVATRKGMGTDYAIKLVLKYINTLKRKYKNIYVLKLDISKYFYTIDHEVLKDEIKDKLDTFDFDVICKIIDSTNKEYVNETISKYIKEKDVDIPLYAHGKGLPIGNMTSQFLSIYYLNRLDHFIVHDLHLKYYCRYMDDFIIFDTDLEHLKKCKDIIIEKLENEYKLKVNKKKTWICNIDAGFSFLGYTCKKVGDKTIVRIKQSNIEKIKKRVKQVRYLYDKGLINVYSAFCSIMTYTNSYKYSDNKKILKVIDRHWYHEK